MAVKRLRQGIRALVAWARSVDEGEAAAVLSPALMPLFRAMRRSERQHSLNVLRSVRAAGYDHPALLVAALLHDCGKRRAAYHLWDRVMVVLVGAVWPEAVQRWGAQGAPRGWRRPFVVAVQHPGWSAELVAAAGGDRLAVALIADHARPLDGPPGNDYERLLAALRAADDAN
ncbi:MAG: HD domain-containing protein [Anaerolineae bacterium]|nr:HD domain-containing protein [Anaerolineae bacterium]